MATYLFNTVNSAWIGWSNLFEGIPYGDPYVAVVTFIALFAMTIKVLVNRWN
jgi:hypothetical protein